MERNWPCRYNNCIKSYNTRSGRDKHETNIHGQIYPRWEKKQKPYEDSQKDENNFIEIKEVKLMAKKNEKKQEEKDECGKCGAEVSPDAKFCTSCGIEFE